MKMKSEREVAQSCPTLSDPMDCSLPGSSVHGIVQAGVQHSLTEYIIKSLNDLVSWTTSLTLNELICLQKFLEQANAFLESGYFCTMTMGTTDIFRLTSWTLDPCLS